MPTKSRGPGGTDIPNPRRTGRTNPPLPDDIEKQADIIYKTVDAQQLALDLYGVKGRKYNQAPLAIWIHGGGYVKGDKEGAVKQNSKVFVPLLKEHGYRVASLNYRLCTLDGAKVLDCSTDCKDAIRFLVKNHASFGINPSRIATLGSSAGGGLALLMPLTRDSDLPGDPQLVKFPSAVKCAVSWFGCTDFTKSLDEFNRGGEKKHILFNPASDPGDTRQYDLVSPVWYMRRAADKTPILLVHGASDPVVPHSQSVWMNEEARRIGFPVEFISVKNMRHGFQPAGNGPMQPGLADIWKRTLEFILKNNL